MKQTIFETRQKAEALLKEAIAIWRQSDQSDYLEGLENDPVFALLMMAIAYQGNELDSEIEHLKEEVLDEFARQLAPYEVGHATPATMVVKTGLLPHVPAMEVGANTLFQLAEGCPFMPLFRTRVLNASVRSMVRIDGRQWKVILDFAQPIMDLNGFTFAIDGLDFRDLTVTIGRHQLPLIKPWDYSEMPFNECFVPHGIIYNRQQVCNMSMLPMDLFARHNVRMFCVDKHPASLLLSHPSGELEGVERVELLFEFTGISEDFLFDKTRILLNTLVLVNAQQHEATLTSQKPIMRIAGYAESDNPKELTSRQFMHLLQPSESQLFGDAELAVRQVAADRFNQGSLVKLLNCILNKYHSDFYAFQNVKEMATDKMMYNLQEAMGALMNATSRDLLHNVPGVYLLLNNRQQMRNKDFSLSVKYLTTAGAAANKFLKGTEKLTVPSGFDSEATAVIKQPVPGTDEITSGTGINTLLRYYMLTNDRLVTPADIKVFCYKELTTRYGLSENMIGRIRINRRQSTSRRDCGYEIMVEITLTDCTFVRRNFTDSLPTTTILLQKMIEIRTTGIYPVSVNIKIEEKKK